MLLLVLPNTFLPITDSEDCNHLLRSSRSVRIESFSSFGLHLFVNFRTPAFGVELHGGTSMAARVFCIALLIFRVFADNVTTSLILPDGLFWGYPASQTFVGQSTVIGSVTVYTINCGSRDTPFYPGPYGCDNNNSYTFSAAHATTHFLIPKSVSRYRPFFQRVLYLSSFTSSFKERRSLHSALISANIQCPTQSPLRPGFKTSLKSKCALNGPRNDILLG